MPQLKAVVLNAEEITVIPPRLLEMLPKFIESHACNVNESHAWNANHGCHWHHECCRMFY